MASTPSSKKGGELVYYFNVWLLLFAFWYKKREAYGFSFKILNLALFR